MSYKTTRREMLKVLRRAEGDRASKKKQLLTYIKEKTSAELAKEAMQKVDVFCSKLFHKLDKCNRNYQRLEEENAEWLDCELVMVTKPNSEPDCEPSTSSGVAGPGRREVAFSESSERSKRRKTETLRSSWSGTTLAYAARMKYREEGELEKPKLLQEIEKSPTRAGKIRKSWVLSQKETPKCYNPEEALALILEVDLTRHQYQLLRNGAKNLDHNIYPAYNHVLDAKKECYPKDINVTESVAEVSLQSLLDHTTTRILQIQEPVLETIPGKYQKSLQLISKWGCDGTSGQAQYKQIAQEEGFQDTDIFFMSAVPLQLFYERKGVRVVVWQNQRPSSARFCRPIKLQFRKETVELARQEVSLMEEQIRCLTSSRISIPLFRDRSMETTEFEVTHSLQFTMVDGKICNAITQTSSAQTCYVCGATPKQMNSFQKGSRAEKPETFRFGLSTLHAWIRFMEWLLHVAYRLDIKKWQVRKDDQLIMMKKKTEIQKAMKVQLGLHIDEPRQVGSGTSNDGNTARRFFQNYKKVAAIMGLNEKLVEQCGVLLQALSCGLDIDPEKFEACASDIRDLYVKNYSWFYMPASIHKILAHGSSIISHGLLPIGQMSEEAQEARNKHIKQYREHHSRKCSREETMRDVFFRLLLTSDPKISTLRNPMAQTHKKKNLSLAVLNLLKEVEAPEQPSSENESE